MAKVLPLASKYYGTKVQIRNSKYGGTDEIVVWCPDHDAEPFASEREISQNGWTPEDGHDHVEDAQSFKIATIIAEALTKAGF